MMGQLAAIAAAVFLAGCADAGPRSPTTTAEPGGPTAAPVLEETAWSGTYTMVVSAQADGQGARTNLLRDGDTGFEIPSGSQRVVVEVVIDDSPTPLAWELALHGICDGEPKGETHVQGQSPLRIELDAANLDGASCERMIVFLQAADDATLPAAAKVAVQAEWTATVLHPAD